MENEILGHTVTAGEWQVKGLSWRRAPAVRLLKTEDVGPLHLDTDSLQLGTLVTSVLAALISGCKRAWGVPQAHWNFQCIV